MRVLTAPRCFTFAHVHTEMLHASKWINFLRKLYKCVSIVSKRKTEKPVL